MKGWPDQPQMEQDVIIADGKAAASAGKPIKDVIFDFGNVLVYWIPENVLKGSYAPEAIDFLLDNERSGLYDSCNYTDGGMTIKETVSRIRQERGDRAAELIQFYFDNFEDSLAGPVPGARHLLADLKAAGIGVWGLSNWSAETFPIAYDQYEILHMLDGKVISGPTGMRKPHADIFNYALDQFHAKAETSLFVDDKSENIAGANAVGIRGVQFSDPLKLRSLLIEAGVDIPAPKE